MRCYMRKQQVLGERDEQLPEAVGMDGAELEDMFQLLAIADYRDRYVIPQAHTELAGRLAEQGAGAGCSLDFDGGPGNCGAVPAGNDEFMVTEQDGGHGSSSTIDLIGMLRRRGGPDTEAAG
jgi:nitrate reductase / nitrite oxidoreductase, beta subunit